jgi:hypothetical protein
MVSSTKKIEKTYLPVTIWINVVSYLFIDVGDMKVWQTLL